MVKIVSETIYQKYKKYRPFINNFRLFKLHHIPNRDIKKDNIIININVYLNLIDFGALTVIKDSTSTTAHYIGPEVLSGKGYNFPCAYWSLGVIAFKINYNYFPFENDVLCKPKKKILIKN